MPRQVSVTLPGQKVPLKGADKENTGSARERGYREGGREGVEWVERGREVENWVDMFI